MNSLYKKVSQAFLTYDTIRYEAVNIILEQLETTGKAKFGYWDITMIEKKEGYTVLWRDTIDGTVWEITRLLLDTAIQDGIDKILDF